MYLLKVYNKETKELTNKILIDAKHIDEYLNGFVFDGEAEKYTIKLEWINRY